MNQDLAPTEPAETHAGTQPPSHEEGNPLLKLDPGMAVWTWIVFFVLLFLLSKFAWKPILKTLDEREKKIKKALEDAEAARLALEAATHRQNQIIGTAEDEARTLIERARESAQNFAMDLKTKAMHDAEQIHEQAKRAIESEKERAISELRKEVVDLSILAASKLVSANLDDDRNRDLVKKYIQEVTG